MLEVKTSESGATINIHEGDEVLVDIASENFICAWVHAMEFAKVSQVETVRLKSQKAITGGIQGDFGNLLDFKADTYCDITGAPSKAVIEYDFGKNVTLNGHDANYDGSCFIRIWYKDRDKWIPLVWDN